MRGSRAEGLEKCSSFGCRPPEKNAAGLGAIVIKKYNYFEIKNKGKASITLLYSKEPTGT